MPIPPVYRTGAAGPTVQFTWQEAAANIGYVDLYPCITYDSNATRELLLTTNSGVASDRKGKFYIQYADGNAADDDFDFEIKTPMTVANDDAYFECMIWEDSPTAVTVTVYHVDSGNNETSLGSATLEAINQGTSSSFYKRCMKIPLSQQHFAPGDKLRLNFSKSAGGGTDWIRVYFDPSGRQTETESATGATISTRAALRIPFKIQI